MAQVVDAKIGQPSGVTRGLPSVLYRRQVLRRHLRAREQIHRPVRPRHLLDDRDRRLRQRHVPGPPRLRGRYVQAAADQIDMLPSRCQ